MFCNCVGFTTTGSQLLQYSLQTIDLSTNTIKGHFFGYNSSTEVNRYGIIVIGY